MLVKRGYGFPIIFLLILMARHSVSAESVFSCLITYCLPYAQESKEGNPVLRVPLATFTRF